jgi:putative transposase
VLHVINRANRRATMFSSAADYNHFAELLAEGLSRDGVPLYAYCLMPNHWHLVLRVADAAQIAKLMHWVTTKHARAWHTYRGTTGEGHLYQGRYKAFSVQADQHFLVVCRYVERNPLRAGLVEHAYEWRWSSHARHIGRASSQATLRTDSWPVARPQEWREWVDLPQSESELAEIRTAIRRGTPFGDGSWRERFAATVDRCSPRRRRGRPRKQHADAHILSEK